MMTVATFVASSPIHGVGLFATRPIAAGTVACRWDDRFDLAFSNEEVERMPPLMRGFLEHYGYQDDREPGFTFCEVDNGRFMNHSPQPNLDQVGDRCVALRDIAAGEELTCDYRQIHSSWRLAA
ncbi:MAG TPA: SET domain-containing protein [Longimicrobium sp.]|jgi:hypothetical protein|uniref:SET domain-containing protein n=1 Tax=Longimicrobium sp. TaxID=2029185 RepID=UPI002EDB4DA8